MTVYLTELVNRIEQRHGTLGARELAEKMIEIGVIDHTLCKVLAVREHVGELMARGAKKVDAMWMASEKFCCSYEYVRKCVYYYTDVNLSSENV